MKTILISAILILTSNLSSAQYKWTQVADFGGGEKSFGFSFTIGNKAYVAGCGSFNEYDFWEYNPQNNQWSQKANIPNYYCDPASFAIGQFGYILYDDSLQRYDPAVDSWKFMGILPYSISDAVAFSINGKGYLTSGFKNYQTWEYDPLSNVWVQKGDCPRIFGNTIALSLQGKAYIVSGSDSIHGKFIQEVWEYNPQLDIWKQKSNFPGLGRLRAAGFSMNAKGYFGTGLNSKTEYSTDFWEYNSANDSWNQILSFPGIERQTAVGFSLNNEGYVGTGYYSPSQVIEHKDFWKLTPTSSITKLAFERNHVSIFPNPCNSNLHISSANEINKIEVANLSGQILFSMNRLHQKELSIDLSGLTSGFYIIAITQGDLKMNKKLIVQ